jgi:oxygen-dependent protoporphyrinogen oxidase
LLQVVIIGGGISGLSAAYFLEQFSEQEGLDLSIHLMESRDRLGGVIQTERWGDFLLEAGPDSFLSQKPAAVELCRELDLVGQLIPSNDARRKTYVIHQGKAKPLPDGLMFVVPTRILPLFRSNLLSPAGKARLALSPFVIPPPLPEDDVSVAEFITQRFGREVLDRLAEPLLSAVYGADVDSLSTRTVLPQLIALEEQHGSLWRGLARRPKAPKPPSRDKTIPQTLFVTLRGGVADLVTALKARLHKTNIATGRNVQRICRDGANGFRVDWSGGETRAAAVIVATPAHAAGRLLHSLDLKLSAKLSEIPYHSPLIVSLGFAEKDLPPGMDGFGFIVPRSERKNLIACTRATTKFSFRGGPGSVLLRCFLGASRNPAILQESDDRILQITLSELAEMAHVKAQPKLVRIVRWEQAMPQYTVGHPRRLEQIQSLLSHHPGLFVAGNGYRGVGIPDCIQSASSGVRAALSYLRSLT